MKKKLIKVLFCVVCIAVGFGAGIGYRYTTDKSTKVSSTNQLENTVNNEASSEESNNGNNNQNSEDKLKNTEKNDKQNNNSNKKDISSGTQSSIKSDAQSAKLTLESKFTLSKTATKTEPSFNTPWKSNTSGGLKICIEGKGEEAVDEGIGDVILKDGSSLYKISLEGDNGKHSPIYVEWFDNKTFLMTVASSQGQTTGATLYKVNIDDLKPMIVYKATSDEQISEASKTDSNKINVKISNDSNGKSTPEEKNITIS